MKKCKLHSLPVNKTGIITDVLWQNNISRRLMELGFIKGEKVKVLSVSGGTTFVIEILDYKIEMRKNALALIEVEYE